MWVFHLVPPHLMDGRWGHQSHPWPPLPCLPYLGTRQETEISAAVPFIVTSVECVVWFNRGTHESSTISDPWIPPLVSSRVGSGKVNTNRWSCGYSIKFNYETVYKTTNSIATPDIRGTLDVSKLHWWKIARTRLRKSEEEAGRVKSYQLKYNRRSGYSIKYNYKTNY